MKQSKIGKIPIAVRLTQQVDGVVSVIDKLTYRYDDSGTRPTEHRRRYR
ncbi:hypothetical protein [Streptomyces sp. 7N604]